MFKKKEKQADRCTQVWNYFQKCLNYHDMLSLNDNTEKAYRFYEGDQWHGLDSGDETLPVYNFIKPTVNYKVSMIAMNNMVINYSVPGNISERISSVTSTLNMLALRNWERLKMDTRCWEIIRDAAIAGDSYIYFYDEKLHCQIINNTNIFFADAQQPDIQKQPYIIIAERRPVNDVMADAKRNGISKDKILEILPDSDLDNEVTTEETKREVETKDGKCTCLLYLQLDNSGDLHFMRCTKHVIYQPEKIIKNYKTYPIASLVFNRKKGSCRGRGEVLPLISNQIEVNRNLARRLMNAKLTAYSKLVYAGDRVRNIKALTEVGTAIEVDGATVEDVTKYINYLSPAQMSSESANITTELMTTSRDLAGAGDAAVGNIDPTQASGTAIIAVRDQAAIPLNEHTAAFRQFVEDVAKIWLHTERVYNPNGIETDKGEIITPAELENLDFVVRIDVSSTTPFSKYAREQAIERLFSMGQLSFEEYVEALDDDSSVPKAKLEEIIAKRREQQMLLAQQQMYEQQQSLMEDNPMVLESEAENAAQSYGVPTAQTAGLESLVNQAVNNYGGDLNVG